MENYAVVKYDDGIYACVSKKAIKSRNGHHSAKWKNIYYNVQLIKSGNKQECEWFIAHLKETVMNEKVGCISLDELPTPTICEYTYNNIFQELLLRGKLVFCFQIIK